MTKMAIDSAPPRFCSAGERSPSLLSIEEACARAARYAAPLLASEAVPLAHASGHTLAADVHAVRSCPPFDQSAMDGYALSAGDGLDAGSRLPVQSRVAAGDAGAPLGAGMVARIFTGAPIPSGADAVVLQEKVQCQGRYIVLERKVAPGEHIRRRGEDVASGDRLLAAGQRLDPRHVALLAAQGITHVAVRPRPRVAIVSTGNEILPPGSPDVNPAAIFDSNRPMLLALAAAAGLPATDAGCVRDDSRELAAVFRSLARSCDLIVTTGGASVGEEDHARSALARAGGMGEAMKIALKPGKPAVVGRIGGAAYLGLPGNPVSALVSWSLLGRAVLSALEGRRFVRPSGFPLPLVSPLARTAGRTEFRPARLSEAAHGTGIEVLGSNSSRLRPLAEADGLVELPACLAALPSGTTVTFHPFEGLFSF